jgi:hypothetical protein
MWQKEALECKMLPSTGMASVVWSEKLPPHECGFRPRGAQGDTQALSEVAKCYKQVEPDELLLSQEARRVVEYLEASGPRTSQRMAGNLDLPTWQVLDAIIEARDAGRISLSGDEYSIVRD